MNKKRITWLAVLGAFALGAVVFTHSETIAQARLNIGGSSSNFGRTNLRGGFMPDPFTQNIRSGGTIDISNLGLGNGCRGHATGNPDFILNYQNAASWVRFFFRANGNQQGRDTTLVINDANGRWHCDDDSGGSLNPMVDISNPPSGQYDIWVGSYRSGQYVDGVLNITELRSQRP